MGQKDRKLLRVDEHNDRFIGGAAGQLLTSSTSVPSIGTIPAGIVPSGVVIGAQTLLRSTLVPKVLVQVSWNPPSSIIPEQYIIQSATVSGFTANLLTTYTDVDSVVLELNTNTDYWVRVQAVERGISSDYVYPSNFPAASLHTISDTTAPLDVNTVTTSWATNDLEIKWVNPTSDNFFDTRVRIYDKNPGSGGTLYKEVFVPGTPGGNSRFVFTLADNNQVTGNTPLTSVYYTLYARSIGLILAVAGVSGTVAKATPSIPTGLTDSWVSDDGTFDESVTFAWNPVSGADTYLLTVDGKAKETIDTQYVYSYSENVKDHRPTLLSGDNALAYTIQAANNLGQLSGGASGTATNHAPNNALFSVTTVQGFSALYAYINQTKDILDLHHYHWVLKSGGVNVTTVDTFTPEVTFTTLNGVYTLDVTAIDMFGNSSGADTVSGITLDGLTITQLRAQTKYTDSIGTDPTILDGLKDGDLSTTVVTYASGLAYRWTKAERPLLDRYKTITVATNGTFARLYFGVSSDDVTYRWFAAPLTGTFGTVLTEYASEALAQSNEISTFSSTPQRFDLPSIAEGRFVKMGHRRTSLGSWALTEFYPRRIIQSDDIEAESIKAINIAAGSITADRLSVTQLSAITANIGQLVIDTGGYLWQGTGTAASPTTGLKIYNSGGIGRLTTYRNGTAQVDIDTNGQLTAGAGSLLLFSGGLHYNARRFTSPYKPDGTSRIQWRFSGAEFAAIEGYIGADAPDYNYLRIMNNAVSTSQIDIIAGERVQFAIGTGNSPTAMFTFTSGLADLTGNLQISNGIVVAGTTPILYVNDAGGSKKFILVNNSSASADTLLSLENSSNDIGGGSYFIRATKGSQDRFYVKGDGTSAIAIEDTATTTITTPLSLFRRSTVSGSINFGGQLAMFLDSNTTDDRNAAALQWVWTSAIDASRTADLRLLAYDTAAREGFRIGTTGSAAKIGFFANAGAAKQTVTGTRTGTLAQLQTVVANLLTALVNYNFITDSTT